jgi:hypothetical protein
MKRIRITCIPSMESEEAIITAEVVLVLNKMDSYAVAARVVNAFRDWDNIYGITTASQMVDIVKKGGGRIMGSRIEVVE